MLEESAVVLINQLKQSLLTDEEEVELPAQGAKSNRADLGPKCADKPVSDTGGKSATFRTDLIGHHFRHVCP